ncbi:hypothetical protein IMX26_09090 [Clostridium sp. 'deep sea']|uniref:DUF5702 domain-containing protein n=1 Tax=Clostridium sp. 'deep sea' TaxID=2779445 RepID=UPI00189664BD|nr:DUF5702 domain-containing protein [Clostridium sp. 'deep sea']QOR33663.1 hypothetical protein IMX26_09090 [Clostridium sp. 'deep sea']
MNIFYNNKGAITVFLVLLLVPSIVIVGAFIDFSRYHTAQQIVNGAGELALDSVLANYNSTLKKYYGLFAISNKEYFEGTINEYFIENLTVKANEFYSPFNLTPYSYEILNIDNANLANPLALKKQIVEHSKYKAPLEYGKDFLNTLNTLKDLPTEVTIYNNELELNEKLASLSLKYQTLYALMKVNDSFKIASINDFINEINDEFKTIAAKINTVNYLQTKLKKIDFEQENALELQETYQNRITEHLIDIKSLASKLITKREKLQEYYLNYQRYLDEISTICEQITRDYENIKIYVEVLKNEIQQLSQNCEKQTKIELHKLERRVTRNFGSLINKQFNFKIVSDYIKPNQTILTTYKSKLQAIRFDTFYNDKQLTYSLEYLKKLGINANTTIYSDSKYNSISTVAKTQYYKYYSASKTEVKELYDKLHSMYKDVAEKNEERALKKAQELFKKAIKEKLCNSPKGAKEIPQGIFNSFSSNTNISNYQTKYNNEIDFSKSIFGSISSLFQDISYNLRDNLYVNNYIKTMFTCATSKIGESCLNYSLSPKTNYLFGSEQEYLLFGNRNAMSNVLLSKSLIYSFRFVLNYKYALSNNNLLKLVKEIATVSAAFIPFSLPLIETTILTAIVATETALDLEDLMSGKEVVVFKTDQTWRLSINAIKRFFEGKSKVLNGKKINTSDLKMSYQDYLSLLLLVSHSDKQVTRISNLIELNISNILSKPQKPQDLKELSFKTINAKTAIKLKAEVILNLIFLPIPFVSNYVNSPNIKGLKIKYNSYRGY